MKLNTGTLALLTLVFGTALYSPPSHAFVTLFCGNSNNPSDDDDDNNSNSTALIKESVNFECSTTEFDLNSGIGLSEDHHYSVRVLGYGLGLRGAWYEGATIFCPTVRKAALGVDTFVNRRGKQRKGVTEFYGLKVSAEALIGGADVGAFVNRNGGMCFLAGIQAVGLGAGASAPMMEIIRTK